MLLYPFKKTVIRDFQGFEKLYKHCKKNWFPTVIRKLMIRKRKKSLNRTV